MGGHVRLDEQDRAARIDPARDDLGRLGDRAAAESGRVPRKRQRVEVDDAQEGVVLGLERDPVAQRAEVVADVGRAGRLDAAEDPLAAAAGR
jgi:hypothetical protein